MRSSWLYIALVWLAVGCSDSHNYAATVNLPDSCWTDRQNAIFEFATLPGSAASEISVFIQTDIQFIEPFADLTVKTIDPDGLYWEDVLQIPRVVNDLSFRTSSVTLRRNIRWLKQGNYTISIRPNTPLCGTRVIGVNISNVINKPKK